MSRFQPAPLSTYIDWLLFRLDTATHPTHWYDYPYPQRDFLLATADFTTGGECGVNARSIIVPATVRHLGGNLGHNDLFHLDRDVPVPAVIPIYNNPEFLVLPGIDDFIAEAKRRDRAFWAEQGKFRQASEAAMRESNLGQYVCNQRARPNSARWRHAESFFANGTQGRCLHVGAVPVEDLYGEVVAALCPTCDEQLGTNWRVG